MDRDPAPATDFVTSTELLAQLRTASAPTAWHRYSERYRPLVVAFAQRAGLPASDAEDAAQQTLIAFYEALRAGKYDRDRGRLRSWLFGIARNTLKNCQREQRRDPAAANAHGQTELLNNIPDDEGLSDIWQREWEQAVTRECLEAVRSEVEPATFLVFQLMVTKSWPAARVAEHTGMKVGAVFGAKQRVVKRLRELVPQLEEVF